VKQLLCELATVPKWPCIALHGACVYVQEEEEEERGGGGEEEEEEEKEEATEFLAVHGESPFLCKKAVMVLGVIL